MSGQRLGPTVIEEIGLALDVVRTERGRLLCFDNGDTPWVGLVVDGQVEISRWIRGRKVIVDIARAGHLVGAGSWLTGAASVCAVRTMSPVVMIRFDRSTLARLAYDPAIAGAMLAALAVQLEDLHRRLTQVACGNMRDRVAIYLLDATRGEAGFVALPQSTLAGLLGASRSRLNRVLKALESEGAVRLRYRRVIVRDPSRLRHAR